MKAISYIPSEDELVLKFHSVKKKPTKKLGHFKFWWDKEGNIYGIAITPFTDELKAFEERLGWIRLSGIWNGVKIGEQDIREARQELLQKLEKRGDKY